MREKIILYFYLSDGILSSLEKSAVDLLSTKKNVDEIEKNTQSLFISLKRYNLGVPGTGFIIKPTFIRPGGATKGPTSELSNNLA